MIKWFNKYSSILRASIITALEYKANSIVGLFAIFSGLLIEYLIWSMIYSSNGPESSIQGLTSEWTFKRLIAYIFLSMIIGQLKSSWVTSHEMIMQIRQGFMNQYIVKPLSFFSYHLMNFIGTNILYYIPYTILIIGSPYFFKDIVFTNFMQIPIFIFAIIISIYLSYSIYFFMVCFAFWFGEVRALLAAYNISMFVLAGQIIPLDFFPESYNQIINFTPIPYLIQFPVNIAMQSNFNFNEILTQFMIGLIWCFIMRLMSGILYKIGIRRYEAYGS
tara:strand:+ start:1287 stop:2114 length:828 start_codon:yes stop_codon:yes gene_type:complete